MKRKFQKIRKGKLKKFKLNNLKFGFIGLKALESGILNYKQIENIKQIIAKKTNYKIKIWVKNFVFSFLTKKPIGVRMGKGKGKIAYLISKITAGDILFEFCGIKTKILINSIKSLKYKLPIKTKIVF